MDMWYEGIKWTKRRIADGQKGVRINESVEEKREKGGQH